MRSGLQKTMHGPKDNLTFQANNCVLQKIDQTNITNGCTQQVKKDSAVTGELLSYGALFSSAVAARRASLVNNYLETQANSG